MGCRPDLCGIVVRWEFFQREVICTSQGSWFPRVGSDHQRLTSGGEEFLGWCWDGKVDKLVATCMGRGKRFVRALVERIVDRDPLCG